MALLSCFAFKERPVRENFGKEGGQGQPRIQIDDTLTFPEMSSQGLYNFRHICSGGNRLAHT